MSTAFKSWHCVAVGCGTAGLASLRTILHDDRLPRPARVLAIDNDQIGRDNSLTCPEYRHFVGWPKVRAIAELVCRWSDGRVSVDPIEADLEDVDWNAVVDSSHEYPLVVVAGIDDYDSRLGLVQVLRAARSTCDAGRMLHLQMGLDRDSAVVSAFSDRWTDACPACHLPYLPQPEPCLVLDRQGVPTRGDLQGEAYGCAKTAVQIITEFLAGHPEIWINRKVVLTWDGGKFHRRVFDRRRMARCLGAHWPTTALAWNAPAQPDTERSDEQ